MTETNSPTPPAPDPAPPATTPRAPKAAPEGKGYAAYDTTYLRFLDGVHDTKAKAEKQAKAEKVTDYEIREV